MNTEKTTTTFDTAFDEEFTARVSTALDTALSAPPSPDATAAISAAARRHARRVRIMRRIRLAAITAAPIAACLTIILNVSMRQSPDSATPDAWQGADIAPLLAIVELSTPEADDNADDELVAENETNWQPFSPFDHFSRSLVAMQDYPSIATGF